jgi:hypothetical protein
MSAADPPLNEYVGAGPVKVTRESKRKSRSRRQLPDHAPAVGIAVANTTATPSKSFRLRMNPSSGSPF